MHHTKITLALILRAHLESVGELQLYLLCFSTHHSRNRSQCSVLLLVQCSRSPQSPVHIAAALVLYVHGQLLVAVAPTTPYCSSSTAFSNCKPSFLQN